MNPTGRFCGGRSHMTLAFTGCKIIVDTYGGTVVTAAAPSRARTASKVDRSAASCRALRLRTWLLRPCPPLRGSGSPTPSARRALLPSWSTRSGRLSLPKMRRSAPWKRCSIFAPAPSSALSRPAPSRLREDGGLWAPGRDDEDFTWEHTDRADELARRVCGL